MISTLHHPGHGPSGSSRQAVSEPRSSRIVTKPLPKAQVEDPRAYQIAQLRKRYSPRESTMDNATTSLVFKLAPSDPDFPFELDHLECDMRIPKTYPKGQPPTLAVLNKDMPRGFAINVEKGWDKLVEERKGATLLSLTNALDKNLESFLTEQKAETVKLTIFKDTRHLESQDPHPNPSTSSLPPPQPQTENRRPYFREPSFSRDQIAGAKARRAMETRQIETRMGRLPQYHRSSDGIIYTLPLEPKRREQLPPGLKGVKSFQLIVPLIYPLQPLRIFLSDADPDEADQVEEIFAQRAAEKKDMSLMSHINSLAQSIHLLAKQAQKQAEIVKKGLQSAEAEKAALSATTTADQDVAQTSSLGDSKSHIQVIARPPEWSFGQEADQSGEESSDSDDSEDEDGGVALTSSDQPRGSSSLPGPTAERGTAISFPSVELHGIELLQVSILSISVKCERCRTINEIGGLKPNTERTSESCRKCATAFTVQFRPELVHAHSTRAGFIDATGCTVADMLPSTLVPTCGKCSTATPQGFVSVRGDTTTNVCRECHARFTFKIPEVKFLAITAGSALPPTSGPRRRQEKLGLHAGEPLPDRGSCKHYKKSYRWFRFSCCQKVHPCDKCHDELENHLNEWANRMICGYCSREQNYAVDSCGFCGRSVIGKRGKGFWEGGKGTRDQTKMSRKDPRKYKRIGGGKKD